MTAPKPIILPSTRTGLAMYYSVRLEVFNYWVEINPKAKELLQPFIDRNRRVLPPQVVQELIQIFGEP